MADPSASAHGGLDAFAEAARELLDGRLDAHAPFVDLEDVVERAHDLAPDRISEAAIARARHAPAPPSAPSPTLSAADAAGLEGFNRDLRELLDAELAPRDMAAVLPPRRLATRRRPAWTWAAAAVVLLVAGGAIAGIAAQRTGSGDDANQAEYTTAPAPQAQTTIDRKAGADTSAPAPAPAPAPVDLRPDPTTATETDATPEPAKPDARPAPAAPDPDTLAELDALAQSQWKAGNERAAERTFEKIVKLGGRTAYAEQAYGELFALAHQLHGERHQAKLWRAYLRRFPRGRYADGARAGLCRESEGTAKRQCWTRYLDKHPKGAARAEALRETAE